VRPLSENAKALMLEHEGFSERPEWPREASGVTIGVGYDLGYVTKTEFRKEWGDILSAAVIDRLSATIGLKGLAAKAVIKTVRDITIPIKGAHKVFFERSLPKYQAKTQKTFPGVNDLPHDVQGVLVSLVYNRGTSMKGDRRREMRNIRALVPKKDLAGIAAEIRSMKRLWKGKGVNGLLRRREDEAKLIEESATP
jgi:GH24 family phage-related lysozyme (muramidase)